MSDDDLMTAAAAFPPEQPEASSKEDRAHARRNSILRVVLVGAYLYVVFGILLPRIVDYGDMLDAFQAAPPSGWPSCSSWASRHGSPRAWRSTRSCPSSASSGAR